MPDTIRVTVKHQDAIPPAILPRMVGTRWWRQNCHGALTLNAVDDICCADVRETFSTFHYGGHDPANLVSILHTGVHAWLKEVVQKADSGKAVRAATYQLDPGLLIPGGVKGDRRNKSNGGSGRVVTRCKVSTEREDGSMAPCYRMTGHEGGHRPQSKRTRNFARR